MLFSFVTLVLTLALAGSGLAADAPSRKKVQAPAAAAPVAPPPPPPSCQPAEFREICLTVHDPLERKRRAKDWLVGHGAVVRPVAQGTAVYRCLRAIVVEGAAGS